MSFTTIIPTYTIPIRRSIRVKASQGLITEVMEHNLGNFFNEDNVNSSHPNHIPMYPIDETHDEHEDVVTRVSIDKLSKLDNQFDNCQEWMSQ